MRDHSDHMVDQMNQWILVQSGFIGSFDLLYDQSDLGSLIVIRIISKERTQVTVRSQSVLQN